MFTTVHVTTHGGVPVLHVAGDLDFDAGSKIRRGLTDVLRRGPHALIVVDLTHVHFTDSTGLGVLVHARREQQSCGGDLSLVVRSDTLLRTLRISSVARLFTMFDDVDSALASGTAGHVTIGTD
jgi:anti-sigma B factor antagonist